MKHSSKKYFTLFLLLLVSFFSKAQNTTFDNDKKTEAILNAENLLRKNKVLIIPFEPKMYMSEIDKKVNAETKLKELQIVAAFREGLDEMLYLAIKQKTSVYSFLNDSAKCAKDMAYTYKSVSYSYEVVPQENATVKELNKPADKKNDPKIVNGQIAVLPNMEKKFMNRKVIDPQIIPYLNQKYGSSIFIFINELDIKNNPESYDITTDTYKRDITVHYTIADKDGKYLAYGIATSNFSSSINDPQKISKTYFSPIANTIANKLVASLIPDNGIKYVDKPKNKPKFE
jgi:hypothetical protein